ncbi:MAG: hypothetical protein O7E52_18855 [Candidatus Poribacteria bacterium]|nr:hypothetical protein [Candidatus Poribacteria bacterium]
MSPDTLAYWIGIYAGVGVIFGIVLQLWINRQNGPVLMRYRSKWDKRMFAFSGLMSIWLFLCLAFLLMVKKGLEFSDLLYVFILLAATSDLYMGRHGLEIRAGGISQRGNFLKWEQVQSYQWKVRSYQRKGETNYTLGLNRERDPYPWWLESWSIPPIQKEAMDKLLGQYLPVGTRFTIYDR